MKIIITGTSSGIGLAIAEKFLNEGHEVWGVDKAPAVIDLANYTHITGDIRTISVDALPEPEILINNAGTLDEAEAIDVNLTGTIRFTELMREAEPLRSVLFIASASARNGAEFPHYCASKAGLVAYMKNLALALAKRGVTCNSISPGGVITPANEHILESEKLYEVLYEMEV